MNKACAAECFLEMLANWHPLEESGDCALAGQHLPELDWQYLSSESAVHHYRQNNVPVEDLCAGICLASVRNYLSKNVGNRPIGKVVGFQGAVAFNRGMVAAYETMLGRRIVVPPYPHLTGAIGAAKIAYEEAPAKATFRGSTPCWRRAIRLTFRVQRVRQPLRRQHLPDGRRREVLLQRPLRKFSGRQKRRVAATCRTSSPSARTAPPSTLRRRRVPAHRHSARRHLQRPLPFYQAFFTELGFEVVP